MNSVDVYVYEHEEFSFVQRYIWHVVDNLSVKSLAKYSLLKYIRVLIFENKIKKKFEIVFFFEIETKLNLFVIELQKVQM